MSARELVDLVRIGLGCVNLLVQRADHLTGLSVDEHDLCVVDVFLLRVARRLVRDKLRQVQRLLGAYNQALIQQFDLGEHVEEAVGTDGARREGLDIEYAVIQVRLLLDLAERTSGGVQRHAHSAQLRVEAGQAQFHHLGADLLAAVVVEVRSGAFAVGSEHVHGRGPGDIHRQVAHTNDAQIDRRTRVGEYVDLVRLGVGCVDLLGQRSDLMSQIVVQQDRRLADVLLLRVRRRLARDERVQGDRVLVVQHEGLSGVLRIIRRDAHEHVEEAVGTRRIWYKRVDVQHARILVCLLLDHAQRAAGGVERDAHIAEHVVMAHEMEFDDLRGRLFAVVAVQVCRRAFAVWTEHVHGRRANRVDHTLTDPRKIHGELGARVREQVDLIRLGVGNVRCVQQPDSGGVALRVPQLDHIAEDRAVAAFERSRVGYLDSVDEGPAGQHGVQVYVGARVRVGDLEALDAIERDDLAGLE